MKKGKLHFEVTDWTKIKFMVKCTWGIEMGLKYPEPVINEYFFETWLDMTDSVSEYMGANIDTRRIILIAETPRFFNVEAYEVATKFRVV